MSLMDYAFFVICIIAFILLLTIVIWRITCFFKKTCKWKNCPYRQYYHYGKFFSRDEQGCKKFPPTKEEIDEYNQMLDNLDALIEHLKNEDKSTK